ncbi:MAG: hypothetical protein ACKOBC_08210 [Hyphomicrobiales bacterium]
MKNISVFLFLLVGLSGCGFSKDVLRSEYVSKSDLDICVASVDERPLGFAVRREVALDLIKERDIKCDVKAAKIELERRIAERKYNAWAHPVQFTFPH